MSARSRIKQFVISVSGGGGGGPAPAGNVVWGPDFGEGAGNDGITDELEASLGDITNYGINIGLTPSQALAVSKIAIASQLTNRQAYALANLAIKGINLNPSAGLSLSNIKINNLSGGTAASAIKAPTLIYTYRSAGTFSVAIPSNATSLKVDLFGAGGGGGNQFVGVSSGSGGAGGEYAGSIPTFTPGSSYTLKIGQGGSTETAGTSSTWQTTVIVANGGSPGQTGTAGGQGGASTGGTGGTGTTTRNGGDGGGAGGLIDLTGGGGGGSAGELAVGGNGGSNGTAGIGGATNGGNGGAGSVLLGAPDSGQSFGGGGGGASSTTLAGAGSGSDGGAIITIGIS